MANVTRVPATCLTLPKPGVLKLAEALPDVQHPELVTLSRDAAGQEARSGRRNRACREQASFG